MNFAAAATEFRARFPGDLARWDGRPQSLFDGFVIDAWCWLFPRPDEDQTRRAALILLEGMVHWLQGHAELFESGDLLRLVVAFPASVKQRSRQIFKCWIPAVRLPDLQMPDFVAVGGGFQEMDTVGCERGFGIPRNLIVHIHLVPRPGRAPALSHRLRFASNPR